MSSSHRFVLGVDAGGTHTRAVVVTATGTVVGRGEAGGANLRSRETPAAAAALVTALRGALTGVPAAAVVGGVVAVAGAGDAGEAAAAEVANRAWAQVGLPGAPTVTDDIAVAFAAGTDASEGAVLTAGTGAVAAWVRDDALARRADGYGWLVGDEGSAVWLGMTAVRAALAAHDGRGAATALVEVVQRVLLRSGDRDFGQAVVAAVYAHPPAALGVLAPAVCAAAEDGDAVADGLCAGAAERLVAALAAVAPPETAAIVLGGGLLLADNPVGRRVRAAITVRWPDASVSPAVDCARGAALLALRAAGVTVDEDLRRLLLA